MPRRTLPPEPPQNSEAPPPPLPSRPNFRPAPPRPIVPANRKNNRRRSPSPEDGETYEVPDLPPSGQGKSPLPPPPQEMDGELYDELEGIASGPTQLPPQEEDCEEIYDPCEVKDADDGDLYEDPNEKPNPVNEEEEGEIYDAPEESVLPAHRPPPMAPPPPSTNTIPDDNDGESRQNTLKDQLNLARQSLKKRSPSQNNAEKSPLSNATDNNLYFTKSKKPENEPTAAVNTTNLSLIQQRIAMMRGQNIAGGTVPLASPSKTNHAAPKPAVRNYKPVEQTTSKPLLPVKPKAPEKKMGNTWNPETKSQTNQQAPSVPPPLRNEQTTPPPYSEEIYDDALAFVPKDPLDDEKWYHADRDRKECESDITKKGQDGTYLVRNSTNKAGPQPYTLVVLYKGHVYNLRIRKRDDNKIALGNEKELEQELAFDSVPELISHHTTNEVILINQKEKTQYRALLKEPLLRVS